ncbi:MAG: glycosyltransferase [Coriobacteriales bacterium]|jgi:glycosyltransferase involved in cell wall biosynthesis|nr:glycosyltransferase [Coriobacteriales bacterium]
MGAAPVPAASPRISVIVPCYNVAATLARALLSLQAQTMVEWEAVCVDDGSSDGSLAILRDFAAADQRFRILHKANSGYGDSMNQGIRAATGEWIAILEPDDWLLPAMFATMLAFAARYDQTGAVVEIVKTPYWRVLRGDGSGQAPDRAGRKGAGQAIEKAPTHNLNCSYRHRIKPARQPFEIDQAWHLLTHHPSIWSALYRRSFLQTKRIEFAKIPGAGWADNPFLFETLVSAERIVYLDEPFYCYQEETDAEFEAAMRRDPLLPFRRWQDCYEVLVKLGRAHDQLLQRALYSRGFTYLGGVLGALGIALESVEAPEEIADRVRNDDIGGSELSFSQLDSSPRHPELDSGSLPEPLVEAIQAMCAKMDPETVLAEPELSPAMKRLFLRVRDLPDRKIATSSYRASLFRQGLYNLRNVGLSQTWKQVKATLSR